ncbi:MAG: exodeoxyribonuclease VII large subunit [Proteobacteria bacterium]|nr:exodeoxyribonuclease VII large subunit [Pseudomonadota bacterium]
MSTRSLDELLGKQAGKTYTVSQLNREARALLEASFASIWVEGEVSNLVRPASGHQYFTLKDNQAQVRCALFKGKSRSQRTQLRDGLLIRARARVSLYEGRGEFQLIVDQLEEAGEGALQLAFNALVSKLKAEGLFESEHKQPLPTLPRRIGVITSPTGAVIHDIITTLGRRFPGLPIRLYPVAVQGDEAAPQIIAAIEAASQRRDCDVLIIGRGGGSLEDLWPFNEEAVARSLFACPIPVVSAVGHETDVTITDFIADVRAATPTAAAEMASPDRNQLLQHINSWQQRLIRQTEYRLQHMQQRSDNLSRRLVHPSVRLQAHNKQLSEYFRRIKASTNQYLHTQELKLAEINGRLAQHSPASRLARQLQKCQALAMRSGLAMKSRLGQSEQQFKKAAGLLHGISPLATLGRGYAVVLKDKTNTVVKSVAQLKPGDNIETRVSDGSIYSAVTKTIKESS